VQSNVKTPLRKNRKPVGTTTKKPVPGKGAGEAAAGTVEVSEEEKKGAFSPIGNRNGSFEGEKGSGGKKKSWFGGWKRKRRLVWSKGGLNGGDPCLTEHRSSEKKKANLTAKKKLTSDLGGFLRVFGGGK